MTDLSRYSLFNLIKVYQANKAAIHADIRGETYEGLSDDQEWKILGLTGLGLILFIVLGVALWVWALVALINNWKLMPTWAQIIGVIGLLPIIPFSVIATLLLAYLARK